MSSSETRKKELTGQVFAYNELVSYQTGSVVSRTVIDTKAGTVTVFAFDAGQGLSEHTAPFDALIQVTDGRAIIRIDGTDHPLKAGESIIMPAQHPHAVKAPECFKMVLVMIRSN